MLVSHQDEPCSMPGQVTPGFSDVGIMPDDAAGQQVFLGTSNFPIPFILALLHYSLQITLISSQDFAVKSRPNLFTHFTLILVSVTQCFKTAILTTGTHGKSMGGPIGGVTRGHEFTRRSVGPAELLPPVVVVVDSCWGCRRSWMSWRC
ncbi:hypothetical protein PR048_014446 [Dryococelus australis]|uniref:Uncharacterized protein n=1 Tax=Dryococelus australis TaxID=614101 RepID=A0ABQ9HEE3_9NEOP|nr:hypothetical protein PR048_014446 [Dryococelus australis]